VNPAFVLDASLTLSWAFEDEAASRSKHLGLECFWGSQTQRPAWRRGQWFYIPFCRIGEVKSHEND
jgi:hypothetical protein